MSKPWDQPVSESTAQRVLEISHIAPDDPKSANLRVLDFGCGNGRYMEVYARCVDKANIYGVEVDAERVAQVRQKGFQCAQLDIQGSELPYADEFFDIVFSSNVIEHIPRRQYLKYLEEIHRVLHPGGRFLVGTPNYPFKRIYDVKKALTTGFFRYYFFDDPTHCNKLSVLRLEKDLAKLFVDIHLHPTYLLFQERCSLLQRADARHRLRIFGDKVFGYCVKPRSEA
jgi:cyclopropane fatty-acyl-phospholipid synthase-like methyltransferase